MSNPITTAAADTGANPAAAGHPRGLYVLFFTEMWERFSYYGMRALLVLFMVEQVSKHGLGFTETTATAIYGLYTSLVYLVALPGGWIADRLLGARRSVWYGGMIIAAGHFTLAVPSINAFYLGLILIVIGTGLLKPNISAIVGDLYPEGGARRDAGFTIFYMGINLGATLGAFICSLLGEKVNWHYGFAAAGVGMVCGLIQYKISGHHLGDAGLHPRRKVDPARGFDKGWYFVIAGMAVLLAVIALGFARVIPINPEWLAEKTTYGIVVIAALYFAAIFIFGGLNGTEKKRLVVLIALLLGCAMFWSGFEQAGSSMNLFAKDYTDREIGWLSNYVIPAGWFQTLNSIFIIVLAPVMAMLWTALARRSVNPSIPAKFAWGLILLGAGFLAMAWASELIGPGKRVWPTWLIVTYLLHTIGELCLSPVGLSAVTKLSPARFVGQMLGLWFVATALGNLIAGQIAGEVSGGSVEQMPALYMRIVMTTAGAGLVMLILSKPLKRLMGDVN